MCVEKWKHCKIISKIPSLLCAKPSLVSAMHSRCNAERQLLKMEFTAQNWTHSLCTLDSSNFVWQFWLLNSNISIWIISEAIFQQRTTKWSALLCQNRRHLGIPSRIKQMRTPCSTFRYPALRPFIIEWMMSLVRCKLHSIVQVLLSLPQQYIILFKVESVSLVCNSLDHGRIGMTVHVSAAVCISDLLWHNGHTHTAIFYRLRGTMAICLHSRRHISKWHHRKFTAMHSIAM